MQPVSFDTVLCPVDFSELSGYALRAAAMLSERGRTKLVAVYANWFEAPPYFTEGRIEELKSEFRESLAEAKRALGEFAQSALGSGAPEVEIRIEEGRPAEVIGRLATEVRAGLVVMGTHGRTGYDRWMLGSVTERVLRESAVPVLTVRGPVERPIQRILCPVVDNRASRTALAWAMGIAGRLGATVTALNVRDPRDPSPAPNLCDWVTGEERSRCSLQEVVRHGDPATEIVALAVEENYDLLALGAPRRNFFEGLVLGATAVRAIRHAQCPVLTVGEGYGSAPK